MAKETKEIKKEVEQPGPMDTVEIKDSTSTVKPETVKKAEEDEMVSVKKSDLKAMMDRMDKQSKDIDLLYKVADKSRLQRESGEGENLIKTVKVSMWDNGDIPVVGWTLISNRCEVVLGRWIEEQTVNLVLEDGQAIQVPLLEFYRKTLKKIAANILSTSENTDYEGKRVTIYNLEFPNGKKLSINNSFIN